MSKEKRKLGFFGNIFYFVNILLALALLVSSFSSYVDPRQSMLLGLFSLFYPAFLIGNFMFMVGWMLRVRSQFLLSFIAILITWNDLSSWVRFGNSEQALNADQGIVAMSYNVRLFNRYGWIEGDQVPVDIERIVTRQDPDIFCIQEYYRRPSTPDFEFAHEYIWTPGYGHDYGLGIMSKHPIIDTGAVTYDPYVGLRMNRGFIWADILIESDTIRVVNVHLASMQLQDQDFKIVDGEVDVSNQEELQLGVKKFGRRIGRALVKHGHQIEPLMEFIASSPYPILLCSDMNDTHSGYSYSQISSQLDDTFMEAGKGFGKTFPRFWFPLRIDHIFVSDDFSVRKHGVIWEEFSDHYPVVAEVYLR